MSAIGADERLMYERVREPTPASTWYAASGGPITDELLEWPPDLFALANVVLARAEAFRFALSPVDEWPPTRHHDWARAVEEVGRRWSSWVEDRTGAMPDLVAEEWSVFRERAATPLEQLAVGRDSRTCEALLTLQAIADEACAGLGIALDASDAEGCIYRARGRELLARTGSLARVDTGFLRVLPKVSTPPTGRPRGSIKFGRRVLAQDYPCHAPPHRPRTFWEPRSSQFSRRGQRVCRKPRHTHPSASTLCWRRPVQARHGGRRSGSRSHPPDSATRWNRSPECFVRLRSLQASRNSTKC